MKFSALDKLSKVNNSTNLRYVDLYFIQELARGTCYDNSYTFLDKINKGADILNSIPDKDKELLSNNFENEEAHDYAILYGILPGNKKDSRHIESREINPYTERIFQHLFYSIVDYYNGESDLDSFAKELYGISNSSEVMGMKVCNWAGGNYVHFTIGNRIFAIPRAKCDYGNLDSSCYPLNNVEQDFLRMYDFIGRHNFLLSVSNLEQAEVLLNRLIQYYIDNVDKIDTDFRQTIHVVEQNRDKVVNIILNKTKNLNDDMLLLRDVANCRAPFYNYIRGNLHNTLLDKFISSGFSSMSIYHYVSTNKDLSIKQSYGTAVVYKKPEISTLCNPRLIVVPDTTPNRVW